MKILGIDYGRKKTGLATAVSDFAEPYKVLRVKSLDELILKIIQTVNDQEINKIVVGISEGAMGEESKNFSKILRAKLNIPIETHDETLSTFDAQHLSKEAGIKTKRRREMEDAFAASVMLQNYLDFKAN